MQPHSGQDQVNRPSDSNHIPVGVPSCSSCLPSAPYTLQLFLSMFVLTRAAPNRPLQTIPKGCDFTALPNVHIPILVIPSCDPVGSGRRKEVELGQDLDKSKPQPWALPSAVLCSPELSVGAALWVHVCHDILCILSEGTKTEG